MNNLFYTVDVKKKNYTSESRSMLSTFYSNKKIIILHIYNIVCVCVFCADCVPKERLNPTENVIHVVIYGQHYVHILKDKKV